MKSKFKNLNFEGVEVLSVQEKSKVVGGYNTLPATCGRTGKVYGSMWQCVQACPGGCV